MEIRTASAMRTDHDQSNWVLTLIGILSPYLFCQSVTSKGHPWHNHEQELRGKSVLSPFEKLIYPGLHLHMGKGSGPKGSSQELKSFTCFPLCFSHSHSLCTYFTFQNALAFTQQTFKQHTTCLCMYLPERHPLMSVCLNPLTQCHLVQQLSLIFPKPDVPSHHLEDLTVLLRQPTIFYFVLSLCRSQLLRKRAGEKTGRGRGY